MLQGGVVGHGIRVGVLKLVFESFVVPSHMV